MNEEEERRDKKVFRYKAIAGYYTRELDETNLPSNAVFTVKSVDLLGVILLFVDDNLLTANNIKFLVCVSVSSIAGIAFLVNVL